MAHTVPTSSSVVRPSSPTPPHHMFLSAADIFWRHFHYNRRILFFKLDSNGFDSAVSHLKSSLASALVPFFPWAGRVFKQESGRLALDCNDAGVPFIEAYVDLPFSRLQSDGFKLQPFFDQFAPHGDVEKWTGPEVPLLSVQVTRFSDDEGFVLGIGNCHIVADGAALWHFMKSWGECGRGVKLSMQPIHMREALAPEHLIVPPPSSEDEDLNVGFPSGGILDVAQCDFHFTSKMVKKLKTMADSSCPSPHTQFSSLQSLSAHIWKRFLAATEEDGERKCIFHLMFNMRSRLEPPLPEAYFGNAVIRNATVARKEEIVQESIGATALRIQELIKKTDDKFFKTFYGNSEVMTFLKLFDPEMITFVMLQLSGSPRFPLYDVDFGWGPPLSVQSPRLKMEGEMVWGCGRDEGSIDVTIALSKPVMKKLKQDETFLSF